MILKVECFDSLLQGSFCFAIWTAQLRMCSGLINSASVVLHSPPWHYKHIAYRWQSEAIWKIKTQKTVTLCKPQSSWSNAQRLNYKTLLNAFTKTGINVRKDGCHGCKPHNSVTAHCRFLAVRQQVAEPKLCAPLHQSFINTKAFNCQASSNRLAMLVCF